MHTLLRWATLPALLALLALLPSAAWALDTTPHSAATSPLTYDARVVGLAGAGVATADGGAAALHNPALMLQVHQLAGTLSFTPYFMKLSAPFQYGNNKIVQKQTGLLFGPFSQLGMALRLHRNVVVGMLGFVTGAAGGTFAKVPLNAFSALAPKGANGNVQVGQFAGELLVPVAVQLTPWLGVAVGYRLTQAFTFAHIRNSAGTPLADVGLRGTHLRGLQAGVVGRIGAQWTLAASYRSEVVLDLSGLQKQYAETISTSSQTLSRGFRTPHQLRIGAQWTPGFFQRLMVTLEGHTEWYKRLDPRERNTFGGALAAEYTPLERLRLRAGVSVASQMLRANRALPTAPPPGVGYSITSGAGTHFGPWRLDVALAYAHSGQRAPSAQVPGRYVAEGFVGSASATLAM